MQLDLIDIKRPLIKLASCEDFFDRDYDSLAADAESGVFIFAWNIAVPEAQRREIRVWRNAALAVYHNQPLQKISEDDVYRLILPRRDIRSTELRRMLSCSQELIHDLDVAGCLPVATARRQDDGPNAFTVYHRAGIETFLRTRRL